jgi:hypothetical protein
MTGIEAIAELFAGPGVRDYLGGPMTAERAAAFEALPYARDALAVRRWDDEAKDPAATPPEFDHFEALLRALLRGSAQLRGVRDSALTAVELRTLNATARPR